jgi:predicted regulator of Ras-like GTPase activity (Roadblock/LC7/MglB family)
MVDKGIGDYFISDADDDSLDDELLTAPVVVPPVQVLQAPAPVTSAAPASVPAPTFAPPVAPVAPVVPAPAVARPDATVRQATREERLASALNHLMQEDTDIQAAALVSLDGFTMASALPASMQPDRVGAMSAAILGLGERAAAELGRGHLSQVFIEGDNGYVLLMAAGDRAVLTVMADSNAKLGLVIYDMRAAAANIAEVLG